MVVQDTVYVILGWEGEYSDREVWVAGVFTDLESAKATAEAQKQADRQKYAAWVAADEYGVPPADDSEYTVVCVPLNQLGKWDYLPKGLDLAGGLYCTLLTEPE